MSNQWQGHSNLVRLGSPQDENIISGKRVIYEKDGSDVKVFLISFPNRETVVRGGVDDNWGFVDNSIMSLSLHM